MDLGEMMSGVERVRQNLWGVILGCMLALLLTSPKSGELARMGGEMEARPEANPIASASAQAGLADVVERALPAVVTVFILQRDPAEEGVPPLESGEQPISGLGSGVILSGDGYVITANHLVEKASRIVISRGMEEQRYPARLVGVDPGTDLALLKIEGRELPNVAMANSDEVRPGDLVLAIGSPFGLRQTVTMGIISAVGRGDLGVIDYENFIQTDAAVNMGNSGGALINARGELIGINTAIFSRTGGHQGIGFAIPSNLARAVVDRLKARGRVIRGYLGTNVRALTPELASALRMRECSGLVVGGIVPSSPADLAGIKTGDVIATINAKEVTTPRQLHIVIGSMEPGTWVRVGIVREGVHRELSAQLAELPPTLEGQGHSRSESDSGEVRFSSVEAGPDP